MHTSYVTTAQQIEDVRNIFREYYEELLKVDICFDDFKKELEELLGDYSEPDGTLILAMEADAVVGCAALRKIDKEICEMKRLFIRQDYRGHGWGRVLADKIVDEAVSKGYSLIRLDTLETLQEANTLYKSMGFQPIAPYLEDTSVELVYWGLDLKNKFSS
jgi:ribosomal protein S18 acetylase RimI-like enzyme